MLRGRRDSTALMAWIVVVSQMTAELCHARSTFSSKETSPLRNSLWQQDDSKPVGVQVSGEEKDMMLPLDAPLDMEYFRNLCPDLDNPLDCYQRYFGADTEDMPSHNIACQPGDRNPLCKRRGFAPELLQQHRSHIEPRFGDALDTGDTSLVMDAEQKRAYSNLSRRLCPKGINQVRCFDHYVTLWMQAVSAREGKRTFGPGKRSNPEELPPQLPYQDESEQNRDSFFMALCVSAENPPACFSKYVSVYHSPEAMGGARADARKLADFADILCHKATDKNACYDDVTIKYVRFLSEIVSSEEKSRVKDDISLRSTDSLSQRALPAHLVDELHRIKEEDHKRQNSMNVIREATHKRALCPEGISKLDCFDHFLGQYAQSGSRGANHFIGRRSLDMSEHGELGPNERKVDKTIEITD